MIVAYELDPWDWQGVTHEIEIDPEDVSGLTLDEIKSYVAQAVRADAEQRINLVYDEDAIAQELLDAQV